MATAARMPWMRRKVSAESMSKPGPFRPLPLPPLPLPPRGSELLPPLEGKKLLPFSVVVKEEEEEESLLEPAEG